jgi:hypothetical protein
MRRGCRAGSGARTTATPTSARAADSGRWPVSCAASPSGCGRRACGQAGWPQPARISRPSRNKGRRGLRAGCFLRWGRGAGNFSAFGPCPRYSNGTPTDLRIVKALGWEGRQTSDCTCNLGRQRFRPLVTMERGEPVKESGRGLSHSCPPPFSPKRLAASAAVRCRQSLRRAACSSPSRWLG